jgi:hypothetical protein
MIFYGFSKKSNFRSKYIGVSLRFYKKSPVLDKNWPKLCIYWLWHPYCGSVIQNGPIYEFLYVLKKLKFSLKIHKCWPTIYRKSTVWGKNRPKLCIFWSWNPYYGSVVHNDPVYEFLRVLKKYKFSLKIHTCAYSFIKNH